MLAFSRCSFSSEGRRYYDLCAGQDALAEVEALARVVRRLVEGGADVLEILEFAERAGEAVGASAASRTMFQAAVRDLAALPDLSPSFDEED